VQVKRASSLVLVLFVSPALVGLHAGCKKSDDAATPAESPGKPPPKQKADPGTTKVTALAVHQENLNVDKIGMRDGSISPDGNRDHVFTATVEGPADALYLVTVDERNEPIHGFRADTVSGHTELPTELAAAGQVDVGRFTVWMALVENGKFINRENGALGDLTAGPHQLKMYVPNTGTLRAGHHLRLYARAPGGAIVGGPSVPY
jgi:hypothetical protein